MKSDFVTTEKFSIFPELELSDIPGGGGLALLIRHDYYSSDSDFGRHLLNCFLKQILSSDKQICSVFFIDSGVCLLSEDNASHELVLDILSRSREIFICIDSMKEYEIDSFSYPEAVELSAESLFAQLLISEKIITID